MHRTSIVVTLVGLVLASGSATAQVRDDPQAIERRFEALGRSVDGPVTALGGALSLAIVDLDNGKSLARHGCGTYELTGMPGIPLLAVVARRIEGKTLAADAVVAGTPLKDLVAAMLGKADPAAAKALITHLGPSLTEELGRLNLIATRIDPARPSGGQTTAYDIARAAALLLGSGLHLPPAWGDLGKLIGTATLSPMAAGLGASGKVRAARAATQAGTGFQLVVVARDEHRVLVLATFSKALKPAPIRAALVGIGKAVGVFLEASPPRPAKKDPAGQKAPDSKKTPPAKK